MTTTERQQEFEAKAGMELISSHTFNETAENVWILRVVSFKNSGRKSWVMWCERNGVEITGTRKNGKKITDSIKQIFKIN